MDINRLPNETELQYIWRLGSAKDSGVLEMTWEELADVFNKELREDDEEWTESAYRKKYSQAKAFYEQVFSKMKPEAEINAVDEKRRELERLKTQYRDERNAWQKQNVTTARVEQKLDYMEQIIQESGKRIYPAVTYEPVKKDEEMRSLIVCLADLHIGQAFSSCLGKYDSDIAKDRLKQYVEEIVKISKRHNAKLVYVACLGDLISGSIHKTIQVTNRENVIDQIKLAGEYISDFCYQLTQHCDQVAFYSVPGNHSRIDRKEDALKDERLDDLVAWFVGNSLKHVPNFADLSNLKLDSTIGYSHIGTRNYFMVHGDLDSMNSASIGEFTMMLGIVPDYIITAHKHSAKMAEINGVTVYQSGSLVGSGDDYTVQHRLSGKPSQLVLVCDDDGVECSYNVRLD